MFQTVAMKSCGLSGIYMVKGCDMGKISEAEPNHSAEICLRSKTNQAPPSVLGNPYKSVGTEGTFSGHFRDL